MTPAEKMGFKVGDKVKLKEDYYIGDWVIPTSADIFLKEDDRSTAPYFDTPEGDTYIDLERFFPRCNYTEAKEFKFDFTATSDSLELSLYGTLGKQAVEEILDIIRKAAHLGQ